MNVENRVRMDHASRLRQALVLLAEGKWIRIGVKVQIRAMKTGTGTR